MRAVDHVAKQVKVPASELGLYEWSGSTIEYHRSQILFHTNMTPYGEIQLRTDRRLDLTDLPTA